MRIRRYLAHEVVADKCAEVEPNSSSLLCNFCGGDGFQRE